jgi:hypothetical protein
MSFPDMSFLAEAPPTEVRQGMASLIFMAVFILAAMVLFVWWLSRR